MELTGLKLRDVMLHEGVVRAKVVAGKESEKTKYEMYYNFEETVPKIPSHRMLALATAALSAIGAAVRDDPAATRGEPPKGTLP